MNGVQYINEWQINSLMNCNKELHQLQYVNIYKRQKYTAQWIRNIFVTSPGWLELDSKYSKFSVSEYRSVCMKSWMPLRMVNWFFDQEFSSQGARRLRLNERPIYFFLFDNNRLLWVSFFKLFEESSFRHNSGLILHLFSSSMFRCNHVRDLSFL